MRISDWSSDVCSSDLPGLRGLGRGAAGVRTDREQLADRACGRGAAVRHAAGRALAGGRRAPWRRYDAGGRLQRPRMNTAQIKPDGTVLGFDVGARRIGVAVGSAFGHGARALAVLRSDEHTSELQSLMRN